MTSGPEPDGDGYTISIDGASPASVATNATFRQAGLTAGNHTVELSGVATNCAVSGALRLGVSVAANAVTTATFAIICAPTTGTIQVTTTTGTPADPDGYQLLLDGVATQAIATAATATIPGVAPGAHTVGLGGVAPDCQVDGDNPRSVTVVAGATVQVNWSVVCTATTGILSITILGLPAGTDAAVTVTGPNGYTQQVTATATLTGLAPGNYALTAAELTSGGTKYTASPASRTITVAAAGTASATVTYSGGGLFAQSAHRRVVDHPERAVARRRRAARCQPRRLHARLRPRQRPRTRPRRACDYSSTATARWRPRSRSPPRVRRRRRRGTRAGSRAAGT